MAWNTIFQNWQYSKLSSHRYPLRNDHNISINIPWIVLIVQSWSDLTMLAFENPEKRLLLYNCFILCILLMTITLYGLKYIFQNWQYSKLSSHRYPLRNDHNISINIPWIVLIVQSWSDLTMLAFENPEKRLLLYILHYYYFNTIV